MDPFRLLWRSWGLGQGPCSSALHLENTVKIWDFLLSCFLPSLVGYEGPFSFMFPKKLICNPCFSHIPYMWGSSNWSWELTLKCFLEEIDISLAIKKKNQVPPKSSPICLWSHPFISLTFSLVPWWNVGLVAGKVLTLLRDERETSNHCLAGCGQKSWVSKDESRSGGNLDLVVSSA